MQPIPSKPVVVMVLTAAIQGVTIFSFTSVAGIARALACQQGHIIEAIAQRPAVCEYQQGAAFGSCLSVGFQVNLMCTKPNALAHR
jgi:hypothetical protein